MSVFMIKTKRIVTITLLSYLPTEEELRRELERERAQLEDLS